MFTQVDDSLSAITRVLKVSLSGNLMTNKGILLK